VRGWGNPNPHRLQRGAATMKVFDHSGTNFLEFERKGDRFELKSRGFVQRYKSNGFTRPQQQQATEGPFIKDGAQTVLSTTQDARNSTLTGTTLAGPSGSGQFLAVVLSAARTVSIASSLSQSQFGTAGSMFYGILQNKPRPAEAADVLIFGVSKVVAGSTSITAGSFLMMSTAGGSSLNGSVNLWSTGPKIGLALEAPTAVGQVITAAIFGFGSGPGST
jgi:hypothetical protein